MDQKYLKSVLKYDKISGVFWWIEKRNNFVNAGDIAGSVSKSRGAKYIGIKIDLKTYKAHRLAWLYCYGCMPTFEIDHIDGNGINNSIANLRDVPNTENAKNRKRYETNASGVSGVHWSKSRSRWVARISDGGKRIQIGSFKEKGDAVSARIEAEKKYNFHENHGKR